MKVSMRVREQFLPLFDDKRWFCVVAHRRAGKTCASLQRLIHDALKGEKPQGRYAFVAPQFNQCKAIGWDYVKHMTRDIPGTQINESELRVDFANGSRIRLFGADNPDRLRGQRFDGIVMDEVAQMPRNLWGEVIRPALADRQGWCGMIGTPAGKNIFWEFWDKAQKDDDWTTLKLRADETGLLPETELAAMRKEMTTAEYQQEMLCSFDAAIRGAYFGEVMADAVKENRITRVPHDPALRVITSWDLGISDSTVIWMWQIAGAEIRAIDLMEFQGVGLPEIVREIQKKQYNFSRHVFPHDVKVRELGTGRSREEVLRDLGIKVTTVKAALVADGIDALRNMIPRMWFDEDNCKIGIEALKQYRTEYDERRGVFRNNPLHDWTSHFADSARYFAMAKVVEHDHVWSDWRQAVNG
jgi:hypothetical protein